MPKSKVKSIIAVVIPSWNGAEFIGDCLKSLENQTLKPRIIVVENGSTDNSLEVIKKSSTSAEVLEFNNNAGFAGGVNRGINYLLKEKTNRVEYIALFNNDAVADKKWLENLVATSIEHPEAGIVTGKLMRSDKKHFDSTGEFYSTHAMPFPRGRNILDKGQFDDPEAVFGATGGASLYRVKMLQQIGLFDEDFFAYYEDADISFRAQLAGWKVWYQPKATAYHEVSATASKLGSFSRFHSIKNFIYLYNKNMPGWLFWRYKPWFFIRLARMAGGSLRDGQIHIFAKSLVVAIIHIPKTLLKRYKIQSARKVGVGYINEILYPDSPPKIPKL